MPRNTATQQEKHIAFKNAFDTVTQCMDAKNYIGAYVIAFSLIEDRIRAMYVVWHRSTKDAALADKELRVTGFAKQINTLRKNAKNIPMIEAALLLVEAKQRNQLLHDAMWNLSVFSEPVAQRAIALTRMVERLRRAQKKKYGQ